MNDKNEKDVFNIYRLKVIIYPLIEL